MMKHFSALIKPASSLCNMRCKYCFYCDVAASREIGSYGIMSKETTENLIDQIFQYNGANTEITLAFQGGEPTVAGQDYFLHFFQCVEKANTKHLPVHYAIQTNGYLMDDEWCKIFREHKFLVGLSQDGTKELHDMCRLDSHEDGTYYKTQKAIRLMEKHKIEYNVLSVVTNQFARHPQAVFQHYIKNHIDYVQLIPCLKPLDAKEKNPFDLEPRTWAEFMKQFFHLWYTALIQGQYLSVRQFDNIVYMLQGHPPEQCGLIGRCRPQFVVEADGSVYPCDFYVLDQYCCGNINTDSIEAIASSANSKQFLQDIPPENPLCSDCKVYRICGGGCRRYREFYAEEPGYCPYQDFLYATLGRFLEVAQRTNR